MKYSLDDLNKQWIEAEKEIFEAKLKMQKLTPYFKDLGVEPKHFEPEFINTIEPETGEIHSYYDGSTEPVNNNGMSR